PLRDLSSFPTRRSSDLSRWLTFKISGKDLAQVFGSRPQTAPGTGRTNSLWLLVGGGVLLLLLGFGAATLWARRQRARLEAALRRSEEHTSELQSLRHLV